MSRKFQLPLVVLTLLAVLIVSSVTQRAAAVVQTSNSCATPSFAAKTDFQVENGLPYFTVTADFNLDNKPDLAVANNGVSVLLGNGSGGFSTSTHFTAGNGPRGLAVGDFNSDGKPDLATANYNAHDISILLGNGSGGFGTPVNFKTGNEEPGNTPTAILARDFNGDSKLDIAVTNYAGKVSVLLGDGAGNFGTAVNYPVSGVPSAIAAGDFNKDAKVDLVVTNDFADRVSILLGNGNGTFSAATSFSAGVRPRSVAVADLNSDSNPDLAVVNGDFNSGGVSVLLGDGSGSFGAPTRFASSGSPIFVTTGDFNLDNKPDLAVASFTVNGIAVLLGNGAGGFSATANYSAGNLPDAIAVGDYNLDGRPDLAVANQSIGLPKTVSIFLNTCGVPKIEVTPPTLAFGSVTMGQTKDLALTVRNTGSGALMVNSMTSNNPMFSATAPAAPFNVAAGGQQNVTVRFAPTSIASQTGTLALASNDTASPTINVALSGEGADPCTYVLAPTSQSFSTLGGTGDVAVTAPSGCAWTVTSNANWITITSGGSGSGNGTINYSVSANLTNAARSSTLTIAGKTFTVTQSGCSFTLSSSLQAFVSGGGMGSVNVSTVSGCAWTATSTAPWLSITSGASGNGNGTVTYSVAMDATGGSRIGNLTIAGQNFTVLQGAQATGWMRLQSGTTSDLRAVHFLNESEGWVAGLNATLLKTSNGGATWNPITTNSPTPASAGFLAVRMLDANTVWIGGSQAAGRTIDGGANWRGGFWNVGQLPTQSSLFPLTRNEALAVGPGVPVSHVFLDGLTLTITHTFSPSGLNDLYAIDADNAWAVGDGGRIYRITDADDATNFNLQASGTTQTLNAVFMLDANNGWVAGNGGTILKTTNGGGTWTTQSSGTTAHLRDVHFVNPERGWAVGDGGVIVTTVNGGTTWTAEASGVTTDLRGVHFVNAGVGYVVGSGGVILRRLQAPATASVSGASYSTGLAADSIASAFGLDLATTMQGAISLPLPTTLAGTTVKVKDNAGDTRDASLFYVAPLQVNYLIPPGTKNGPATVTITSGNGNFAVGTVEVVTVAPGLFAANADGKGPAAAKVQRITADNTRIYEEMVMLDLVTNKFVTKPIDLGPEGDQVFLELYGTGIRKRSALSAVQVTVDSVPMEVLYADIAPGYVGLDQINIRLARSLAGRGEVDLVLMVDGKVANKVRINVK